MPFAQRSCPPIGLGQVRFGVLVGGVVGRLGGRVDEVQGTGLLRLHAFP
jgi:hypothetical protein